MKVTLRVMVFALFTFMAATSFAHVPMPDPTGPPVMQNR